MTKHGRLWTAVATLMAWTPGCATGDRDFIPDTEFYGAAGSGTGGVSASGGAGGASASGGAGGASASGGASGASGSAGASASGGTSGSAGTGGAAGTGASGGTSGASGSAGTSASGGVSGASGSAGTGGASGAAGTGGSGGTTPDGGTDPCSPDPCSTHGSCRVVSGVASCSCDEGFNPPTCSVKNALYGQRVKVVTDLADPDVLALSNGQYLLSGTGPTGHDLAFYGSPDFITWTRTTTYDPSAADPSYDYCDVWSPEIVESGGKLTVYFSAYRGPNGATFCPPPPGYDRTMFRADSADDTPSFGAPSLLYQGQGGAQSRTQAGCPAGGCGLAIRIDPSVYEGRLYYVFFDQGNNVGSIALGDPTDFASHAGPAGWSLPSYEENVNEAPERYSRAGHQYLFFSGAVWNSQYATFYVMSDTASTLTRALGVRRLTTPVRRGNGTLAETHGSNSIVERFGETFNFFGLGVFDGAGHLTGRDTYRQRLVRNDDGTLQSQNEVRVTWPSLGASYSYSLDVVLRDGTVLGPCIAVGRIGQSTSATFTGICPDAADRLVHKSKVQTFRLFASPGGTWVNVGEVAYDGFSDTVALPAAAP